MTTKKTTQRAQKGDVVEYQDRTGVKALWRVQAVRDDGSLQLANLDNGKICLGVEMADISGILTESEAAAIVQATEDQATVVQDSTKQTPVISQDLKLVLNALEAVAARVGEVGAKTDSRLAVIAMIAIAFIIGTASGLILWMYH